MTKESIFKRKFEELDILKGILASFPDDYRENIMSMIEVVTEEITSYLNSSKRSLQEFTLEEFSKYNGKDGMPSYVIISGTVYDTSDVPAWNCGYHFGVSAGNDLTEYFESCHSKDPEMLNKLRPIGNLKQ